MKEIGWDGTSARRYLFCPKRPDRSTQRKGDPTTSSGARTRSNNEPQTTRWRAVTLAGSGGVSSLVHGVADSQAGEREELPVVGPDLSRTVLEDRQRDLQVEDAGSLDAALNGERQEARGDDRAWGRG